MQLWLEGTSSNKCQEDLEAGPLVTAPQWSKESKICTTVPPLKVIRPLHYKHVGAVSSRNSWVNILSSQLGKSGGGSLVNTLWLHVTLMLLPDFDLYEHHTHAFGWRSMSKSDESISQH